MMNRMKMMACGAATLLACTVMAEPFRLGTYNIALYYTNQVGEAACHNWPARKDALIAGIKAKKFDLLGLQEVVTGTQLADLKAGLGSEFEILHTGRLAGKTGEGTAILFRKGRFKLVKEGAFMLSETPTVWGSKSWDTYCPRVCVWAVLQDTEKNGKKFAFFNTHLDHMSEQAREKGAELIVSEIKKVATDDMPVLLTGDMNCVPDARPIEIFTEILANTWEVVQMPHEGPWRSFNNWKFIPAEEENPEVSEDGPRIDYIFVPKDLVRVKDLRTFSEGKNKQYASDHFPMLATVELE